MLKRTISLLLVLVSLYVHSATYYLSPSGSDTNNGTSTSTPWKTLDKVNAMGSSLTPGSIVLLQRGATFRGKLSLPSSGTPAARITIGAYGTGAAPVISGSLAVTGWTVHSGNIWKAPVAQVVKQLYWNGALQTIARYPNTGWLRTDNAASTSTTDAALTQGSGYWTGARMVLRTTNWSYDTALVTAHSGTTLTHSSTGNNLGAQQWGYFLENKLSQLDAAGEWYYDRAAGMLYLWAPGSANPISGLVEAAVTDFGVYFGYQRHDALVTDLTFRHQTDASVRMSGTTNVEVTNCLFEDAQRAIYSTGSNQQIHHNTIRRMFGTGVYLLDNNTNFTFNTLSDIALWPGKGENNWGYFGLRCNGSGMVVSDNRLENIGYIGMVLEQNTLVERNVVRTALAILNDGGGIAIDNADGLVLRKNLVLDLVGNTESVAPEHTSFFPMAHGIYFGNISIKNTLVEDNTVANCSSSGLHVDHTMVSAGNRIKNNVLFNNKVQLSISDFSNYNTPGATAPFHVPSFNTEYSGNIMYCLSKEQECMLQTHVYSVNLVDFGTFTNNYYYNPYNELSIQMFNTTAGTREWFSLERWRAQTNDEVGSVRSPLRQDVYSTVSELSGNLVTNGTFTSNVTGWAGWPTNAVVSRDLTYLDGGALKAYLPNGSVYSTFSMRSPDQYNVQNGQWYRMRFSVQSNIHGNLNAGVKGISQLTNNNTVFNRDVPFDTQRRDMEWYFQSTLTDQAVMQFTHSYVHPQYWLDNVEVHRVTVAPVDPAQQHLLYANDQTTAQVYTLPSGCWHDMAGVLQGATITVQPYSSKIVYRVTGAGCSAPTGASVSAKVLLGGAMNWGTGLMRDNLRLGSLIPTAEPYTAMGLTLENSGVSLTTSLLQTSGALAIVDWVVLELRNNDGGYSVAARRAALVRANGDVIAPDGSTVISFNVVTQGKYLVVRHRNHLSAMASAPIATNGQTIDFRSTTVVMFGTEPLQVVGAERGLWPGEVSPDGIIKYTGASNDRDPVLVAVGASVPSNVVPGYLSGDVNLDGYVKYVGAGNDRDFILTTIGGSVPTATRSAQVP